MDKTIYSAEQAVLVAVLRRLREEQGLHQADVAARLDRPQSFVSKYEAGQRRLDLMELRAVALALNSSLPEVVAAFEADLAKAGRRRRR